MTKLLNPDPCQGVMQFILAKQHSMVINKLKTLPQWTGCGSFTKLMLSLIVDLLHLMKYFHNVNNRCQTL